MGKGYCSWKMQLLRLTVSLLLVCRGSTFQPLETYSVRHNSATGSRISATQQLEGATETTSLDDDFDFLRYHTEQAILHQGTATGLESLRTLARKCRQRLPFDFDDYAAAQRDCKSDTVVEKIPSLLPPQITRQFLEQVSEMEANGWISTNPDSVDGLPSLHLNLVSGGTPLVPMEDYEVLDDFQKGICKLLKLVQEPLYDVLLPRVNQLLNTTSTNSIEISDIFLRRYGEGVGGGAFSRTGISAHYDVYSRVTSVVALDQVASQGTNGLYTTHQRRRQQNIQGDSPLSSSSSSSLLLSDYYMANGATSNHASLRRFFPLNCGDAVVHTWDILHGVDVEPGLDRTSLIVWFTQNETKESPGTVSPWLWNGPIVEGDSSDVQQFVLASALSSMIGEECGRNAEACRPQQNNTEYLYPPSENELYLRSAQAGNTFALTRMGSILEEGGLTDVFLRKAYKVLDLLHSPSDLPLPLSAQDQDDDKRDEDQDRLLAAKGFWFQGAIRGNPLAQSALADELMMEACETGDHKTTMLAATLFALAAQQGMEEASESLARVVEFDLANRNVQDESDFLASPVVQIAQAATSCQ